MNDDKIYEESIIIDKIQYTKDEIYSLWSDINIYDVDRLKEYWKDPLCAEFVSKIQEIGTSIDDISNNLDMLKDCWKKYKAKLEKEAQEAKLLADKANTEGAQ